MQGMDVFILYTLKLTCFFVCRCRANSDGVMLKISNKKNVKNTQQFGEKENNSYVDVCTSVQHLFIYHQNCVQRLVGQL